MLKNSTAWGIFGVVLLLFVALFLFPMFRIVGGGLVGPDGAWTGRYIQAVFENPIYREGLINSVLIAIGTTLLVCIIAIPLAWLSNRYEFAGKRLITSLLLVPMILPPFVGAIGLQQILGQYGALNAVMGWGSIDWLGQSRMGGVILLEALSLYPILYLNVAAALANIDPAMDEAAQNLGITGWHKFFKITLPLIMPGLFAGGTIVFIWSFTELGTPLMLSFARCTPVQVWDELKNIGGSPFPYALVIVMLVASTALYAIGKGLFGRRAYAMQAKASVATLNRPLRGWRASAAMMPFAVIIFIALLPHLGVILTSVSEPGTWYRTALPPVITAGNYVEGIGHQMTVSSISNSLIYSSLAIGVNVVLGIAIAYVVVRSTIPVRGLLDGIAMLPLAVPGLVMAFGYLAVSNWLANLPWVKLNATWSTLLDVRENPTLFLVIAYAIRRLPYMVRSAIAGLQQTSLTFEEAAANLGASWWRRTAKVTLPLISANLVAGALLAFSFSMLEVSDSLILAQRQDYYPITKTIWELFQIIGTGKYIASALGVWAMVFLTVTIVGCGMILGKRMGALFRV